jgi:hypothetical protein
MKTITWKEAVATMNGMAFVIASFSDVLGVEIDDIEEVTRSAFERYCEIEEIEAVERE